MKKIINLFIFFSFIFFSNCTTVQNKADQLIEKEDEYLKKFLNKKKRFINS